METAGAGLKGFSPGDSPFLAKGIVYLTARSFYEHRVPGGLAAVHAGLKDPAARTFLEQRFLTGGWYDLFPIVTASAAAARVCQVSALEIVREAAKWQAEHDLTGIYRIVLAVASPGLVAERLPSLSKQYFNFGDADGRMIGDRLFESNRGGIPAQLEGWFATVTSGYVPVALQKAGAKNVTVRWDSTPDGKAHGVPTVRIRFEIGWEQ